MTRTRGFTLVELVIVVALTGIMAAALTVFLKPAIDSYFAARRRADLSDMADTALRRIGQDVRRAVPNSLRLSSTNCVEFVPTTSGGRYRISGDAGSGGLALDTGTATTTFDVLNPFSDGSNPLYVLTKPTGGDWIVVDNQNGDEVYNNTNRGQVKSFATPTAAAGTLRITLTGTGTQFPAGYLGGRFGVVSNTEQAVAYGCVGNTLYRKVANFGDALATVCSNATLATGDIVVTNLDTTSGCTFAYSPSVGEQIGLLTMRLQLTDPTSGESIVLAHGVHVDNSP